SVINEIDLVGDIFANASLSSSILTGGLPNITLKFVSLPFAANGLINYETADFMLDAAINSTSSVTGSVINEIDLVGDIFANASLSSSILTG
ncbi:hypothetical protein, partial [Escherichia coli]|uniref:hypothetical protein n=1 Tax=Escherichia coli TaxID=562 RepID=UPI00136BB8D1